MDTQVEDLTARLFNRLRLRSLLVFLAVFEQRSVSAAAQKIGLSQSAVSKKILELEDVVGNPLFTRSSLGLQPTLVGLVTYAACERLKLTTRDFAQQVLGAKTGHRGRMALGFAPGFYSGFANDTVGKLTELFPAMAVSVETRSTRELVRGLRCGQFSVVVGIPASELTGPIRGIPVPAVRLAALVADSHPLLEGKTVRRSKSGLRLFQLNNLDSVRSVKWILPAAGEMVSKRFVAEYGEVFDRSHLETHCFFEALMLTKSTHAAMLVSEESLGTLASLDSLVGVLLPSPVEVNGAVAAFLVDTLMHPADSYLLESFRQFGQLDPDQALPSQS
jgi:DNA-binding transcriptional LysR family regulator